MAEFGTPTTVFEASGSAGTTTGSLQSPSVLLLSQKRHEIQGLKCRLGNLVGVREDLEEELRVNIREKNELRYTLDKSRKEVSRLETELARITENHLATCVKCPEPSELDIELHSLRSQLKKVRSEEEAAVLKMHEAQNVAEDRQKTLDYLKTQLKEVQTDYRNLQSFLTTLEKDNEDLLAGSELKAAALSEMEKYVSELKLSTQEKSIRVLELETQLEDVVCEVENVRQEAQAERTTFLASLSNKEEELVETRARLIEISQRHAELVEISTRLLRKEAELKSKDEQLEQAKKDMEVLDHKLRESCALSTETDLEEAIGQLEQVQTDLRLITSQLEETKNDLQCTTSLLSTTQLELEKVKDELEGTKVDLEARTLALEATQAELEEANCSLARKEACLRSTAHDLQESEKKLRAAERSLVLAEDLAEELAELKKAGYTERRTLEASLRTATSELACALTELQEHKAQLLLPQNLEELEEKSIEIMGLEARLADSESALSQLRGVRDGLEAELGRAKEEKRKAVEEAERRTAREFQNKYLERFNATKAEMKQLLEAEIRVNVDLKKTQEVREAELKEQVETVKREKALQQREYLEILQKNYTQEEEIKKLKALLATNQKPPVPRLEKKTSSTSTVLPNPRSSRPPPPSKENLSMTIDTLRTRRPSATSVASNTSTGSRSKVVPDGSGTLFTCADEEDVLFSNKHFNRFIQNNNTEISDRVSELQRRNTLQLPHMTTCYPAEYSTIDPNNHHINEHSIRLIGPPRVLQNKSQNAKAQELLESCTKSVINK